MGWRVAVMGLVDECAPNPSCWHHCYDVIGHMTSSVTLPIDSARPLSYRLPIVNNSLSPVVSEIFSVIHGYADWIEQGLTSPPTQYKGKVGQPQTGRGSKPTRGLPPCYKWTSEKRKPYHSGSSPTQQADLYKSCIDRATIDVMQQQMLHNTSHGYARTTYQAPPRYTPSRRLGNLSERRELLYLGPLTA